MNIFKKKDSNAIAKEKAEAESKVPDSPQANQVSHQDVSKAKEYAGKIISGIGEISGFVTATVASIIIFSAVSMWTGLSLVPMLLMFLAIMLVGVLLGHYLQYGTSPFKLGEAT